MTTLEIMASVRRKILETNTDIVTDTVLLSYINLAFQDVYKRIYPNSDITTATVTFTSGVGSLPSDFGTLYGEGYDTSNNSFDEVSIADFRRQEFDRAITVENGTLKVYPTTTASLAIKYYIKPAALTAAVDPTIDDFFQEAIVYGATYRCHEDLQDETLAQFYQSRFKQEMTDRLEAQSAYEELNQRGGSFFTEQRLISDDSYATF
jgi:hypothetical protein